MEVIIPGESIMDFEFNEEKSSPRFTTGEYYFSAPASPSRISQFYRDFDEFLINNDIDEVRRNSVPSTVPFDWEEKPGTPKSEAKVKTMYEDDFAFDFSQELEMASRPADELFDGGKILPMKPPPPPPRSQFPHHNTTKNTPVASLPISEHKRGRERSVSSLSLSRSGHRATRSLSPLRVSEYPWEEEYQQNQNLKQSSTSSKPTLTSTNSVLSSSSSMKGNKKWKLKDFFLFRSASEGRATDKDPLKKYASFFKKNEDLKGSSFRSIDSPGSSVSSSRRRGHISAHELHYTMNRAVSEDLKKKTFLPYKQGILGSLAFNPAVHAISNGFGFSHK